MATFDVSCLSPMQQWLSRAPDTQVFRIDDAAVSRGELLTAS